MCTYKQADKGDRYSLAPAHTEDVESRSSRDPPLPYTFAFTRAKGPTSVRRAPKPCGCGKRLRPIAFCCLNLQISPRFSSDSSSLARHRRIHSGRRPYRCLVEVGGRL